MPIVQGSAYKSVCRQVEEMIRHYTGMYLNIRFAGMNAVGLGEGSMRYLQLLPVILMVSFVASCLLLWASMAMSWLGAGEMAVVLSLLLAVVLFTTALVSSLLYASGRFASFWSTGYALLLVAVLLGLGLLKMPSSYAAIPTFLSAALGGCLVSFVFPRNLYRIAPLACLLLTLILGQYSSGKVQFVVLPFLAGIAISLMGRHRNKRSSSHG